MAYLGGGVSLEGELSRLRVENQALAEELGQCQSDKEFVWSLWKRLQVASPDITQAIGMVVQREKEKAELKDRKVLDILAAKDDRLDELQKVIAAQTAEVHAVLDTKLELSDTVSHLVAENEDLKRKQDNLQLKVDEFERQAEDLGEKEELARALVKKEDETSSLKKDKADLAVIRDSQKEQLGFIEGQLQESRDEWNQLHKENIALKKKLHGHERVIHETQEDLEHKVQELESVRKELVELWESHRQLTDHSSQQAHLIQQLRTLQADTQKMMKNQEDAFSLEASSMYKRLQEQDHVITQLRTQLMEGNNRSVSTQASLDDKEIQTYGPEAQITIRLQSMQKEINRLKDGIQKQARPPPTLDRGDPDDPGLQLPQDSSTPSGRGRHRQRHHSQSGVGRQATSRSASPDDRTRAHSWSPHADPRADCRNQRRNQRRLEDCRALLKHRTVELEEMRSAHGRRLERLKALQTNYRLCRKQLKVLEEEHSGSLKKRKKPRKNTDPKALQKENSDAVWNELTYYKTENKNLLIERLNLQEEVDTLRVQTAQDAAIVHELTTCLQLEKEELAFLLEQQQQRPASPDPRVQLEAAVGAAGQARADLVQADRRADQLAARLATAEAGMKAADRHKEALLEERRSLRGEVNSLRQVVADRRMDITDLKRDLLRVQRELRRKKKKEKRKPSVTRQYQQVLNRSIQTMAGMFEDFDKDGWEEVSETTLNNDTGTTDVTTTTDMDSLGTQIALTARCNQPPPDRQMLAEDGHVRRINKRHETPERDRPVRDRPVRDRPVRDRVVYRDQASSPITVSRCSPHVYSQAQCRNHVISKKTVYPGHSVPSKHQGSLRHRISTLQREVSVLRGTKNAAAKKQAEQRLTLDTLQGDLQLATQRLATSRATTQRLSAEVERLRSAKEDLETKIDVAAVDTVCVAPVCTEHEFHSLQARLKTSSSELSRLLSQIKEMKTEHDALTDKVQTLTNKLSHTERDLAQKRILVDDLKFKVKMAQENTHTDTEVMAEAEERLQLLAETNSRYKTQVESSQQRIAAVAREKRENESKVIKLSQELEKKTKLSTEVQRKNRDLKAALAELERTADKQFQRLAQQSEHAMMTAQTQLTVSATKLQEFTKFINMLAHTVVTSIHQARSLMAQNDRRVKVATVQRCPTPTPCLAQAQLVAADILNLSQGEVDDLMSVGSRASPRVQVPEEANDVNSKRDRKWVKKCEKTVTNKKEFCLPLLELFIEKLEEKSNLAAKLGVVV